MNVRFSARQITVRLTPTQVDMLATGQVLSTSIIWQGGGWSLSIAAGAEPESRLQAQGGGVIASLGKSDLAEFLHEAAQELRLAGPPTLLLEKDRHSDWSSRA